MSKSLEYVLNLKNNFSKAMRDAEKSTASMDNKMSSLGGKIAGLAAGIGVGALAKEMVTTGAQFDSYKARLETMLGSSLAANNAFNQIKEDAAKTPFDVGSLTQANAMLIGAGAGADDARKMVMGLGNAIAATGGGSDELSRMAVNLQQIKTLGKASALDVKQFAFANIPIYQMLAKTMGKTVEEVREMDISYEQLEAAFEKAAAKGGMFAGGLEKQSKAIGGQLSNLKDQFTNTLVEFYEASKPMITTIISLLSKLLGWVSRNKATIIFIGKLVGVIGMAVVAFKAWAFVNSFTLLPSIIAVNTAMAANPIGAVIIAVTALVGVLALLIGQYKTVQELHEQSLQKKTESAFAEEQKQVDFLISKYEKLGMTKLQAQQKAVAASKAVYESDLADVQSKLASASNESEKRIAEKRMASLQGRGQYIKDLEGKFGTTKAGDTKGITATNKKGSSSIGSGVDVTGSRPQNLVINITKLVESLNISTTNLKETSARIKEEISKVLLETVNDVNYAIR